MKFSYQDKPWLAAYPADTPVEVHPQHSSMVGAWQATVGMYPNRPLVCYFDDVHTFSDIDQMSDAFAAWLTEQGFGPADRMAVDLQNDPEWLIVLLAAWKVGGIGVAINPMLKARELVAQLRDSGASMMVCLRKRNAELSGLRERTPVRGVVMTQPGDLADPGRPPSMGHHEDGPGPWSFAEILRAYRGRRPKPVAVMPTDAALLMYTSGTTGPAKGAVITHGNLTYNAEVLRRWFHLGPDDVILGVAPLFHVTGTVAHMAVAFVSGCSLVLFHRFNAGEALRLAEQWRATFTIGSITVFIALLNDPRFAHHDLSSLSRVASGGAPISPTVVERFEEATGVYIQSVYGLTETTSPSHITPVGARAPVDRHTGALSVGVPVSGSIASVVDPETRQEVSVGEIGEIVVAGPMVVDGYWRNAEETIHAMPRGRLHTGDIGFMNDEGWFFIIDRLKDQINAGGYKIWPKEVEDVLYEHEAVREAAVIGKSDPYRGETIKAFVSLRAGMTADSETLFAYCRANLAAYKYPREIEILDELPKTASGKVLRRELRAREAVGPEPGIAPRVAEPLTPPLLRKEE